MVFDYIESLYFCCVDNLIKALVNTSYMMSSIFTKE